MSDVLPNLKSVKAKISEAALRSGRTADEVRLVLVSKTIPAEIVREALRSGHIDLGENKVQEGLRKSKELADEVVKWFMIGHLQTNKVKDALQFASEIQSLDRLSLAKELDKRLQAQGKSLDVLIQVNTSGEASKYGLAPEEVASFVKELKAFHSLRAKGFMTLATFTPDEDEVRRCFRLLREIRDQSQQESVLGPNLKELSMGMSGDYVWAIEEGATTVRVGQAVFGVRLSPADYWPGLPGV